MVRGGLNSNGMVWFVFAEATFPSSIKEDRVWFPQLAKQGQRTAPPHPTQESQRECDLGIKENEKPAGPREELPLRGNETTPANSS